MTPDRVIAMMKYLHKIKKQGVCILLNVSSFLNDFRELNFEFFFFLF